MSIETYLARMPKVDLHVQFEGAISRDFVLLVAEQTDVMSQYKRNRDYREWVAKLKEPDPKKFDEIARETSAWVTHPYDLARAIYYLGVHLHKQNVSYAEVSIIPAIYTDVGHSFQRFLEAINDGADRARRGWGIQMQWIMAIPRDRPRKSDDIARWATSVNAMRSGVVGLSLVGREDTQPIAQFRKAFTTAERKELARISHFFTTKDGDDFEMVVDVVKPTRLTDPWGLVHDEDAMSFLADRQIPVFVTPTREKLLGHIAHLTDYPLLELLNKGVNAQLASGMPSLYETTLTNEYINAALFCDVSVEQLEEMALKAVRASLLPVEEMQAMRERFRNEMRALRAEHLEESTESA